MRKQDLTGMRFGRLVVKSEATKSKCGRFCRWHCQCDCGVESVVYASALKTGNTRSCGCLVRTRGKGLDGRPDRKEKTTWYQMKSRCYNKENPRYPLYGGRGIKVCDRWLDSMQAFMDDMGRPPTEQHTIERIDNDGNYEPSNCRWATYREQANNRSSSVFVYCPDGNRITIAELGRKHGIPYKLIWARVNAGLPFEEVISCSGRWPSRRASGR